MISVPYFYNAVDVGYTLPAAYDVVNLYIEQWFPKAFDTITAMRQRGGPEQFIWTTHPWLLLQILNNASTCFRGNLFFANFYFNDASMHGKNQRYRKRGTQVMQAQQDDLAGLAHARQRQSV